MRWIPSLLLITAAAIAAAAEPKGANEPSPEEAAALDRLNQHRDHRLSGDQWISDAVRLKQVPVTMPQWDRNSAVTGHAPALVFNRTLIGVARALMKQGVKAPQDKKRYDATAALKAAGYTPEQGALALFAYDAPSLNVAYAIAMTNVIGETKVGPNGVPAFASPEAQKPEYREAGVAVWSASGKTNLVMVLGKGSAKRYAGGLVYNDANHDGRYQPGEGKAGAVVTCGAATMTTAANGAWWLALDSADEAEVSFALDGVTGTRKLGKAEANEGLAWRVPNPADQKKADKLIADLEADPGKDQDRRRALAADLLAGTRIAILDDARAKKIGDLVAPVREDFDEALKEVRSAMIEEPAEYKKRMTALKRKWKDAMPGWFKEADGLALVRTETNACIAAPLEQRAKMGDPVRKLLSKCIAEAGDPDFMEQYLIWQDQLEVALAEKPSGKKK